MNTQNIDLGDVSILTLRHSSKISEIKVSINDGNIDITAIKLCNNSLESEKKSQSKILEFLGFNDNQIKALNYE